MIYISCEFSASLGRFDFEDYIRALHLTVYSLDESGNRVVLGIFGADKLLLMDAQIDGEDIFQICDQDSQGLYEVYEALFEEGGEFQEELAVDDVTEHLIFLWRSVLHPKLRPFETGILEAVGTLFGNECVLAMWRSVTNLTDKELAELGFRKIAQTSLLFRHLALQTEFSRANPRGIEIPIEFKASSDDEKWVMARWENDSLSESEGVDEPMEP